MNTKIMNSKIINNAVIVGKLFIKVSALDWRYLPMFCWFYIIFVENLQRKTNESAWMKLSDVFLHESMARFCVLFFKL